MDAQRRPRVLLVDDERANRSTFERVFRADFDVVSAASAAEAVAAVAAARFDVAVVDYSMPGTNGLDLSRILRRDAPAVQRVILTGYADEPSLAAAVADGTLLAVLTKPWDREDVVRIVDRAVRLARGTAP